MAVALDDVRLLCPAALVGVLRRGLVDREVVGPIAGLRRLADTLVHRPELDLRQRGRRLAEVRVTGVARSKAALRRVLALRLGLRRGRGRESGAVLVDRSQKPAVDRALRLADRPG